MKKIFIILLTISMLFGLVSCFTPESNNDHTVHIDENKDGLCDGCQGVFVDYSEPTLVGKALKHSIEKQFNEAKSLKIDFQLKFLRDADAWYFDEYYDSEIDDWVVSDEADHRTEYIEGIANIEILLSVGDDGIDAKMTATSKDRNSANEEFINNDPETVYIIDGYAYSPLSNGYYKKGEAVPEELSAVLEQLGDTSIDNEKKNELLEALSIEVATVFNIQDNKGSFSFDAKPGIDKVLNYFKNLDLENDTIANVLDDVLKEISPDLTTDKIVDELERIADLTVNEALDELDKWLTDNHETTLQGIYNSILADEDAYTAIEHIIALANDLNPDVADDKEAIDGIMAEIKAFDIRKTINDQGIGDTVIFDIISQMLPPVSTDPETNVTTYITKEELFGAIREVLAMTLAEIEESSGLTIFSTLKEAASSVTINKLNGKLDLNFVGALELATVVAEFNLDVEVNAKSEVEGKTNHTKLDVELDLTVSEISKETVKISLPENSKILSDSFTAENATIYAYYNDYSEELTADFNFTIIDENYCEMEIFVDDIAIDELEKGTVTAKVDQLYYDYNYYSFSEAQDFVFKVDLEEGKIIIVSVPDTAKADNY